jgi:hypothetical protein
VSVTLAYHDDRVVVAHRSDDPRLGRCCAASLGTVDSPGSCWPGVSAGLPAPLTTPAIDFLRDDVADICGALALGGSLLRRLGQEAEALRFESLYCVVATRLAEVAQSSAEPSCSYVSDNELTQ